MLSTLRPMDAFFREGLQIPLFEEFISTVPVFETAVLTRLEDMQGLETQWRALSQRAVFSHFSQSYDWAVSGWQNRSDRSARLQCIAAWQSGRLVAVWPFLVIKRGLLTRAVPLGSGLDEEYHEPLIDPVALSKGLLDQLWEAAFSLADWLHIYHLRTDGPVHERMDARRFIHLKDTAPGYSIDWGNATDWQEIEAGRSGKLRYDLRRDAKRMAELGPVHFELADNVDTCDEIIDWTLARKREWLAQNKMRKDWFNTEQAPAFLKAAARVKASTNRLGLFALRINGQIAAAALCTIDQKRVEGYVLTFDPVFAKVAPGIALIDRLSRWCFENGRCLDMRGGHQPYKERLATQISSYSSYQHACTPMGVACLLPAWLSVQVRSAIKSTMPHDLVAKVRKLLKKPQPWQG